MYVATLSLGLNSRFQRSRWPGLRQTFQLLYAFEERVKVYAIGQTFGHNLKQ